MSFAVSLKIPLEEYEVLTILEQLVCIVHRFHCGETSNHSGEGTFAPSYGKQ